MDEKFIAEMRMLTNAFSKFNSSRARQPYEDVEKIIHLRERTGLTQEQIGKVLRMSKQAWSKKEQSCKRWIEEGRPTLEKYKDDCRLTSDEISAITSLARAQEKTDIDISDLFYERDYMLALLEDATIVDVFLTKSLLACVAQATPKTLLGISQIAMLFLEPSIGDSFTPSKYVRILRSVLVTGIQRQIIEQFHSDDELFFMAKREMEHAAVALKCKAYRQELEDTLKCSCTPKDLDKDLSLYWKVKELTQSKPIPKDFEHELNATAANYLLKGIYSHIHIDLQRILSKYCLELIASVQRSQNLPTDTTNFEEKNLFEKST